MVTKRTKNTKDVISRWAVQFFKAISSLPFYFMAVRINSPHRQIGHTRDHIEASVLTMFLSFYMVQKKISNYILSQQLTLCFWQFNHLVVFIGANCDYF